jgi:hypothetical protein
MAKMTKNTLLRIARIQQIDLFFTDRGFSKKYVHKKIIYPTYFISERTYFRYMEMNAKKMLRENFGVDWEQELNQHKPIDIVRLMDHLKGVDLLQVPEYLLMLQEGAKR